MTARSSVNTTDRMRSQIIANLDPSVAKEVLTAVSTQFESTDVISDEDLNLVLMDTIDAARREPMESPKTLARPF